jgi:hypothetical protein
MGKFRTADDGVDPATDLGTFGSDRFSAGEMAAP